MSKIVPLFALLAVQIGFADRVVLKNGESFDGDFFGASSQEIRFVVDGKIMTIRTNEITTIYFGTAPAAAMEIPATAPVPEPGPAEKSVPPTPTPRTVARSPKPEPEPGKIEKEEPSGLPTIRRSRRGTASTPPRNDPMDEEEEPGNRRRARRSPGAFHVPRGTRLQVRMEEEVDAYLHRSGQTFRAEIFKTVYVNGDAVIPEGAEVVARLVESSADRGGSRGRGGDRDSSYIAMSLDLVAIILDGERIRISTSEVTRRGRASKKERAIEGLSRAGARLGTILTGQTGGVIGDTTEDTVDIANEGDTRIPAGTVLSFTLIGDIEAGVFPVEEFAANQPR